jgi:hypothetical protein
MDRASGDVAGDARMEKIWQALQLLQDSELGRAEELQRIFSHPYNDNWQAELGIKAR